MSKPVYWCGDPGAKCQLTGRPFNGVMYDSNLPGVGWGNWCEETHNERGGSLGLGRGQKYKLMGDGRWLKVAG